MRHYLISSFIKKMIKKALCFEINEFSNCGDFDGILNIYFNFSEFILVKISFERVIFVF